MEGAPGIWLVRHATSGAATRFPQDAMPDRGGVLNEGPPIVEAAPRTNDQSIGTAITLSVPLVAEPTTK